MKKPISEYYQNKITASDAEIRRYEKLVNIYSFARLFFILLGGFLIYKTLAYELIWLTELTFLLVLVGFAFLVKQQGRYDQKKSFFTAFKTVNENELASIGQQQNIYSDGSEYADDHHNYSSDLDIFGKASLYNLTNRCASPMGKQKLFEWFSKAASETEILQRQESVKELSADLDWVQQVKALLLFAKTTHVSEMNSLFAYFRQEDNVAGKLLRNYIRFVPFVFLVLALGAWYVPVLSIPLGLIALTNAILVISKQILVNRTDLMLSKVGKTLASYSDAFREIEKKDWNSPYCRSLFEQLKSEQQNKFSVELKILSVLVGRLEYRLNMFLGMLLNGIMAWDIRQLIAIEDWKKKNRELVPKAFDVLASFEALISLSSLNSNYPDWCFPAISSSKAYTYTATNLSHPLIPTGQRVSNNYALQDNNKIDIITGSNMAGKSTFLRTVGINAVLAFAGAPVCADRMEVTVMNLFAYMRIRDSLNESISTFKAELNRLQLLLEVLKTEEKVYFLVDEMLRGTNSVDKYRGSKAVIETLVRQNAVGMVATHDLQLAELENKYPAYIRNFYFDILVVNGEMLFDYKLKDGECKTFNASLLLKQIGIDVEI